MIVAQYSNKTLPFPLYIRITEGNILLRQRSTDPRGPHGITMIQQPLEKLLTNTPLAYKFATTPRTSTQDSNFTVDTTLEDLNNIYRSGCALISDCLCAVPFNWKCKPTSPVYPKPWSSDYKVQY